jgi:hypothetical protein
MPKPPIEFHQFQASIHIVRVRCAAIRPAGVPAPKEFLKLAGDIQLIVEGVLGQELQCDVVMKCGVQKVPDSAAAYQHVVSHDLGATPGRRKLAEGSIVHPGQLLAVACREIRGEVQGVNLCDLGVKPLFTLCGEGSWGYRAISRALAVGHGPEVAIDARLKADEGWISA